MLNHFCRQDLKNTAVFWEMESFTRLVPGTSTFTARHANVTEFIVQYQPFRRLYGTKDTYVRIQLPLLFEEWKFSSTQLKLDHTTSGIVVGVRDLGGEDNEFAFKIQVPKTDVWCSENPRLIKKVTLVYQLANV